MESGHGKLREEVAKFNALRDEKVSLEQLEHPRADAQLGPTEVGEFKALLNGKWASSWRISGQLCSKGTLRMQSSMLFWMIR